MKSEENNCSIPAKFCCFLWIVSLWFHLIYPHLQELDIVLKAGLEFNKEEARYCAWPLSRLSPVPLVSILCQIKKLLWRATAVWCINVLLARHDGGFAVLSRAFVSKRQKGLKTEEECWFLPAVLRLQSVSFLGVKNGRSNLGARSLALVPTHRGGRTLGPEHQAARTVLLRGIPGPLCSNMNFRLVNWSWINTAIQGPSTVEAFVVFEKFAFLLFSYISFFFF